jgi:ABC-type sugar transport system substrate-binding protein
MRTVSTDEAYSPKRYSRIEFLASAAALAGGVIVGGCGSSSTSGSSSTASAAAQSHSGARRIGLPQLESLDFFTQFWADMKAAAQKGDEFTIINANGDQGVMITDTQSMIAQGFNALMINGETASGWDPVLKTGLAKKMVIMNHSAFPLTNVTQNIIVAHYAAGYQTGLAAAKWITKKTGTVEIATIGARSDPYISTRATGFTAAIKAAAPNGKVVANLANDNITPESAANLTQDALQNHPQLAVIFGLTDPVAQGAIVALTAAHKTDRSQFFLCNVDGQPVVLQEMLKPTALQATASMYYRYSATQSQRDIDAVLNGKSVAPTRYLYPRMVTPANVHEALAELNSPLSPANAGLYKTLMKYSSTRLNASSKPAQTVNPS